MLTGHGDEDTRQRAILAGANGFLTKPFSPIALEQTIRSLLGASSLPPLSPSEIRVAPSTATTRRSRALIAPTQAPAAPALPSTATAQDAPTATLAARRRYADLHETFVTTIEALATALELRAAEVEGHAQRVSLYALAAARRLGVDGDELEQLRWGAILHDVGMIAVPDAILMKPGQLRPEEWALVRAHPEHGARLLEHIPGLGIGPGDRALPPRALRRCRLPARPARDRHPDRRAHLRRRRRAGRHHHRPAVSPDPDLGGGPRRDPPGARLALRPDGGRRVPRRSSTISRDSPAPSSRSRSPEPAPAPTRRAPYRLHCAGALGIRTLRFVTP